MKAPHAEDATIAGDVDEETKQISLRKGMLLAYLIVDFLRDVQAAGNCTQIATVPIQWQLFCRERRMHSNVV